MSRAFVKDAEDKGGDLPDRPISPHHNFVTESGLAAIDVGELDGRVGQPMRFEMGDWKVDYTAEGFLLSFSIPNFSVTSLCWNLT